MTQASPPDAEPRLHRLFESCAARHPEAVALLQGSERTDYRTLEARSRQLALRLLREGVAPGRTVGLFLEHGVDLVTAFLGVLRAGGACVPMDPAYPEARLAVMVEVSQPCCILTTPAHLARVEALTAGRDMPRVCLGGAWDDDGGTRSPVELPDVSPESLAFVLFTSGSTGRPKGVMMTHRSRGSRQRWTQARYGARPEDRHLLKSPLGFGTLIRELFWPLTTGGTLVLPTGDARRTPAPLARLIAEQGVSILNLVPTLLRALLEEPDFARCERLRHVFVTGEPLPVDLQERFFERCRAELHTFYGSTEVPTATAWDYPRERPPGGRTLTIGRPTDQQVYLLDADRTVVAPGAVGELWIAGDGLARGYLGDEAATAERFPPHPFEAGPEARIFRTGDLGRELPDGTLEYLGRVDEQVKVGGCRVEVAEVRAALLAHPGIRDAAVVARREDGVVRDLVAYLVPADGLPPLQVLRAQVAHRLPAFMVPAAFVPLEALPLSAHGKLDRTALPAPTPAHFAESLAPSPPRGEVEEGLARIWSEVLGGARPSRAEGFRQLGGHSLAALRAISRVRAAWGVELPLASFEDGTSLAEQAARLEALRHQAPALSEVPGPREEEVRTAAGDPVASAVRAALAGRDVERVVPQSPAQRRIWFLEHLGPGSTAWVLGGAYRLAGPLDVSAFSRAVEALVRRHEPLRSVYVTDAEGLPYQAVLAPAGDVLAVESFEDLAPDAREERLLARAGELVGQPLDLATAPPFRAWLLRQSPVEHTFVLAVHHIAFDGWSRQLLHRELSALYDAFLQGAPSPLAPLASSYSEESQRHGAWLRGAEAERRTEAWRQRLVGASVPRASGEGTGSAVSRAPARSLVHVLPESLTTSLRTLARVEGVGLFTVLLAAWALLLCRHEGEEEVTVGAPLSGRDGVAQESLVGCFVNMLPLRLTLSGARSFRELLGRVRDVGAAALEGRHIPFERIVEAVRPKRVREGHPLFDVVFNLVSLPRHPLALAGLDVSRLRLPEPAARHGLQLYVFEHAERIELKAVFPPGALPEARVGALLPQLAWLLQQVCATPQAPLKAFSLITPDARRWLPDPRLPLPAPPQETVLQAFQRVASSRPEAPALFWRDTPLPYAALARDAARVAHALRARGCSPGTVVAVAGARCAGLVVAALGVLQAGGVLLLLDAALPPLRQRQMLTTARARHAVLLAPARLDAHVLEDLSVLGLGADGVLSGEDAPPGGPLPTPGSGEPAYVVFTSGSTGTPHAVLGLHGSLAHFLAWQRRTFQIGEGDAVALTNVLSFDPVLRDIFLPLTSGATLHIPDEAELSRPERLLPWLEARAITLLHATPTLSRVWALACPRDVRLPSLRWLFLAGEPVPVEVISQWRQAIPQGRIVNLYGATEATMIQLHHLVTEPPEVPVQPAGRPIDDMQALVLRDGRLCGVGELGELAVRGAFLSAGYLGDEAATAARFRPNPFREDPADRLYLLGDWGRYRADGRVEVLGRVDGQLKVRGVRIEPAEVEAALCLHPEVAQAAVTAVGEGLQRRLVAFVVARTEPPPPSEALREFLHARLPAALVPTTFFPTRALPRTTGGKLDRRALAAEAADRPSVAPGHAEPSTPTELLLGELWRELLQVERVGVEDDFFELGGHSLLAVRLMARLRQGFGVELPLSVLFPSATVRGLARHVEARGGRVGQGPLVPLRPTGGRPPLFCIHPAGGSVLGYVGLVRRLSPEQPVYGLEDPSVLGAGEAPARLEERAAHYLEAIRRVRPHGPYLLLGHSFGGLVAYEMAQQLRALGEEVALLALMDTGLSADAGGGRPRSVVRDVALLLERHPLPPEEDAEVELALWKDLRTLASFHLGRDEGARPEGARAGRRRAGLGEVQRFFREHGLLPMTEGLAYADVRRYMRCLRASFRTARDYRPQPFSGPLTYFLAEGDADSGGEALCAVWEALAGQGFELHAVQARHLELLKPPAVDAVAERLEACLRRAAGSA